ncbi:MAG: ABC transporter permease [Chloroflexi bacterium]|nr:ABC transporter permease [Chloroflexota bacterium]
MLVGVSERTPEIGLRRAMGARRSDVMGQFLTEAVLLSLLGGLIGFGLGVLGSQAIGQVIKELNGLVQVTPNVALIALGVSVVVGVASGLYPAWHAAQLQPTQALRHGQ